MHETPPIVSEARARPLKELAREIYLATMAEIDVPRAFEKKVERQGGTLRFGCESVDLAAFRQVWVVSFGKAAWATYHALLAALGEKYKPSRGVVVSNVPAPVPPKAGQRVPEGLQAFHAGHPIPSEQSLAAAEAILELLRGADERTLVFFLISGGGSALVERSRIEGATLEDVKALNKLLVECGASIDEINAIRKHLSAVKGGRLAETAARAQKVTFLLSDVPEGKLATIASGPTLPDPTTVETCYAVAARYQLTEKLPPVFRALFEKRKLAETPKAGADAFARSQVFCLLSSKDVLHAAHRAAGRLGFYAECEMQCDDWPLAKAAACLLGALERMRRDHPNEPLCLVSGGEVLSPVTGDGQGGRNQAFVLHCVEKIAGREMAVLSAGTDGLDGNSPAAGAVADGETLERAQAKGLDWQEYFRRSDSFHFFEALGDALVIGPQQNNLRDLRLLLAR